MKNRLMLFVLLLVSALPGVAAVVAGNLRCEYLQDPQGVEAAKPRLGWIIRDDGDAKARGLRQTAYQVLVASSPEALARDEGDLWDSGRVAADDSAHVEYAGKPLASRIRCFWKARIWDQDGKVSAWSAPARWTMGLLTPEDWQARWIGARETAPAAASGLLGWAVEAKAADAVQWVQIDLGESRKLDQVVLHPMLHNDPGAGGPIKGYGFPLRFRIEIADDAEFKAGTVIADQTAADCANPGLVQVPFAAGGKSARYVRLTMTKLWHRGGALPHVATLAEIEVLSGGANVALRRPVAASGSYEGQGWGRAHLTDGKLLCAKVAVPGAKEPVAVPQELEAHPHAAILLRQEVALAKPVKRATAYMSGLGWSELYLNGRKVGDQVLSPQFTDYDERVPYIVLDATAGFRPGANAIGVILGNGFSATPGLGYLKWYGNGGQPRLRLQIELEFADGSKQSVISDGTWKWSTGEITFNDLWQGEHIDHRLAKPGWNLAGFNDAAWHPVLNVAAPKGRLFARTIPPLLQMASEQPIKIEGNKFTFSTAGSGWLRLKTTGQAGDKLTVNYINTAAGHVHYGRTLTTECILKGGGEEVFEPKFLFHTIDKTVTVDGLKAPATPETLTQQSVCIDLPRTGEFSCSNEFLNRQYQALLRTQRNYNFDYPMDPTREKSGWTQDVMTMIHSSVYDFDSAAFYWNWWQDMRDNQRPDGYLGSVIPLVDRVLDDCNCVWWNGMIVYTPWKLYEFYGDRRFLAESYPAMVSYMNWLATKADKDQIVSWGLGDWIEVGSTSSPKRTSVAITSTCGYYYYATILNRSATLLGKADDAARYAKLAGEIKAGFLRRFLNPQTGQVGTNPDTQTAQILPLYLGMIPDDQRQRVLDRLVANIHERKDHISTGFIGTLHLLLGLPEAGQAELTHAMVMQQDYPGWNTLVQDGVQMETWAGGQVQMPSLGGPIGGYLYQVLAGIRPDPAAPGFKKIILKPAIVGDLAWVNCHHDCQYGRIVSNWKREGDQVTLAVTIPPNTTATVYVPAQDAAKVTEGGKPASTATGVKFLRLEAGCALFEVGSGSYSFASTLPPPAPSRFVPATPVVYPDGRPGASWRLDAIDQGVVLKHGDGPGQCDLLGAREALIFEEKGVYHLFYDGAGPKGWLACLATSQDLKTWTKKGPILEFGKPGEMDAAAACSPWVHFDGNDWHMFYLGTPHTSPAPDLIPAFPYLTLKAKSKSLGGPWIKQPEVVPFRTQPGTYYSATASPGHIIKQGEEYWQFFSASTSQPCLRTLGIARTKNLEGAWTVDAKPIVPAAEQVENTSLYFEPANRTWFLFTNHIGLEGGEYTDAIWVYWSQDLNRWNAADKAVVLDGRNCRWSRKCIGMPSVVKVGNRLAIFYDAPGGDSKSHMRRDLGLAWLNLPLTPPAIH